MPGQPVGIGVIRSADYWQDAAGNLHGKRPQGTRPFMQFGMAVGKSKNRGAVVINGWKIKKTGRRVEESSIVDAIRMLLGEHPGFRGSGIEKLEAVGDVFVDG